VVPFIDVALAATVLEVAVELPERGSADSVDPEESVADDVSVAFCPVLEVATALDEVTVLDSRVAELEVSEDDNFRVGETDSVWDGCSEDKRDESNEDRIAGVCEVLGP